MKNLYKVFVCSALLFALISSGFCQTVMIVNNNNALKGATSSEVANLFLGKTTQWSNGNKATPVDQVKSTTPGVAFLGKIVKMSEGDFKNLWVEKMLSGEAEPPQVKSNDAEIIAFVKANSNAVGYISASTPRDGVKVLPIDGKKEW